ncbi:hypothetical protein Dsin_032408 [Dipteronia sinensis]|uniref:Uncharacterized protein n=1 Tax=Dipteronia sinensis TaxID=43782 RepID=A0AAD9ZNJ8_9ROSI|nr:hypothetical protein Dsin_032408 [Dipteronia sinensis]
MSSLSFESDSNSSSSSNDSLSMTKQLLDESLKEDSLICPKMTHNVVQTLAIHVPLIVSSMLIGKMRPHGGSTLGRRYIHRDKKERNDLIIKDYFKAGKDWLSPLQKMIAVVMMLAYGCSADILDEYVQIGESTAIESLKRFCDVVIGVFEKQYLRKPNTYDIARLFQEGEDRGFLYRSPLFDDLIIGIAQPCNFVVQGHHYNMGYYLSGGIYPQYATLIQTISQPSSIKEKILSEHQEVVKKDVEQAF